jgi:hypothetical protein
MTNPQPHSSNPPTTRQISYLRDLAVSRGQSFAYPSTFDEADREIKRLRKVNRTSRADRRRESQGVSAALARGGDAASVQDHEVGGYGSSAHWTQRS